MKFSTLVLAVMTLVLVACDSGTDPVAPLQVPATYDTTGYSANTASERAIVANLTSVLNEVKAGRTVGTPVNAAALQAAWGTLSPSIDATFRPEIDALINDAIENGGKSFLLTDAPAATGGVSGGYIFNGVGHDVQEQIEKRLFSYLLFQRVNAVLSGQITQASIDNLVVLFGATPAFANSDRNPTHPDTYVAKYAARRDKNDGTGPYTKAAYALRKAKAAVKAGAEYNADRDAALTEFRTQWERALAATVINYMYAAIGRLSGTSVDEATRASAAHSYGEGVGILKGMQGINASQRKPSDADLTEMLANASYTAPYLVWKEPVAWLPKLEAVTKKLQAIYGFTATEMEDFRKNWVSEQAR